MDTTKRCDKCGAQAYVKVTSEDSGLELLFCGHHYKPMAGHFTSGWKVDESFLKTLQPA